MTRLAALLLIAITAYAQDGVNWPSFRGANASGVAEGYETPVTWNVAREISTRWKTPIPGLSHSSPVVWGNRLFVTSAVDQEKDSALKVGLYGSIDPVEDDAAQEWKVYCLDKRTGKILWQQTARAGVPKVKRHPKSTHANPTVATDGKNVLAFFGSEGLYCYDMDGKLRWKKDLGVLDSGFFIAPDAQWGFASSPVIWNDTVIVQCDVLTKPFLAALRLADGKEVWRVARDDVPTWSTPTLHTSGSRTQVIVNGYKHIGGYDAATGKELWRMRGTGDIPVPAPILGHGLIFISQAHGGGSPLMAIRPGAEGDISLGEGETSNKHVAWSSPRAGSYIPTPLVYGDYLYVCRDNGVLSCYVAKTGDRKYQERLGDGRSGFSASPVAADGKVYITSEDGDVYVIRAGPTFQLLATNDMPEVCMATPAISEGVLYYRMKRHLVAIGK